MPLAAWDGAILATLAIIILLSRLWARRHPIVPRE